MAGKPGPIWTEINNDLVAADNFVFLKDAAKAALLIWAIRYPSGNLPPLKQLARDLAKDGPKAFALLGNLKGAGFVMTSPNGSLALVSGWARAHKTSASRVAKFRERTAAHCNVTMDQNVTSPETPVVTLHSDQSNVSGNVSETPPDFQKEIPLRNPLRKTPNSKDEFGESARERAPHSSKSLLSRDYWPETGVVPDGWRRLAEQKRRLLGMPPVDVAIVAEKFSQHHGSRQNQPLTLTQWQGEFIKFALNEKVFSHVASARPSQLEQLAAMAERERLGGAVFEN